MFAVWGDAYLKRYGAQRHATIDESDLFASVIRAIEDVAGSKIDAPSGGLTLVGDLGLDSLALLEVLDQLPLDQDAALQRHDEFGGLTIQSIVFALERSLG